jgi:hypothetical protein
METARKLLKFVAGFVACIVGFYFVVSGVMLAMVLTGRISVGDLMMQDTQVPSTLALLKFQLVSALVIAACVWIRRAMMRMSQRSIASPDEISEKAQRPN